MSRTKKLVKEEFINSHETHHNVLNNIRIDIKCKNERQKDLLQSLKDDTITFCEGSAGTGKTFVTLSHGLKELKAGKYRKIILVKSVTPLQNEEIGYLKGDMRSKLEPIMYSFTGNIEKLVGKKISEDLLISGKVEWMPIAYLRGVSIDDAFIIIDEAQNITIDNIRTILSRIGENSKMVLLGDSKQKDIKNKNNSALEYIMKNFSDIDGIGVVQFGKEHIIRHPIIQHFENRFDELNEKKINDKLK